MNLVEPKLMLSVEKQKAIREIIVPYFKDRDMDELAEKADPLMTKERLKEILFQNTDFTLFEIILIASLDISIASLNLAFDKIGNKTIEFIKRHNEMLEKLQPLLKEQSSSMKTVLVNAPPQMH